MLLCTWVVELKLNELNDLISAKESLQTSKEKEKLDEEYQRKMQSFRDFLHFNKDNVNEETIFQVLQSHGKIDECIKYAELIERYDTVIVHYINK
jgi:vacuolar protein sorting-associated protein 18